MSISFSAVKLLALDVDGVLTDGGVYVLETGQEARRFHIHDGFGIKNLLTAGIPVVVISSGACEAARFRLQQLGIAQIHLAVSNKLDTLHSICSQLSIDLRSVCYVGDDLPDLPVMKAVGFPCAPADAIAEVQLAAAYITRRTGGGGCVREVCDLILQSRL